MVQDRYYWRVKAPTANEHPQAVPDAGCGYFHARRKAHSMADTPTPNVSKFSLTPNERETTVNATDGDELVRVWTAQRKHITKLRRNEAFTETSSGYHGGTEWAEFTIPATDWNPASGAKRKRAPLTDEQRQALADRLAKARQENAS